MKVKFTTSKGNMVAELFKDATPKTVANFTKLISEGFYEELKFHRVIPNFMVHAGPNTGSSQFFICYNRQGTQHLDRVHTAFGKVIEGLDILDEIAQGDTFSISLIK